MANQGVYHREQGAFRTDYIDKLALALRSNEFVGPSPLGPEFVNTEGFSLVFRRDALAEVISGFPVLEEYLSRVIFDSCNAFYLNPLIMRRSSAVRSHIDCRLIESENIRVIPNLVSILYVRADPDVKGGNLTFNVENDSVVSLKPNSNDLVYFRGDVVHSVSEIKENTTRISLVCEQYNLSQDLLCRFPHLSLITDSDLLPRVSPISDLSAN